MTDVARRAGVSAATVSMSLRNMPSIPAATRERIARIARRLGYQPNPFISALMRSRRQGRAVSGRPVLALVCALDRPDAWRNAPSAMRRRIFEGALERAAKHGYQGQEFWLHQDGMSPARFSAMLHARGIQGLLLGPLPDGAPPPPLHWANFSTVSLSVPLRTVAIHAVCNDHYFSSLRAVQECHRLGYRRPGLIFRSSHRAHFQGRWEAGFFTAQQSLPGIASLSPFFVENLEDLALFPHAEFKRWLDRARPDVVLALGTDLVERALAKAGRRAPRDIGLVSLSCPEPGHRLSGICQHGQLIGATAVDVLMGLVERHEKGLPEQAVITMVEGVWNPGATLRPQAAPAPARRRRPTA